MTIYIHEPKTYYNVVGCCYIYSNLWFSQVGVCVAIVLHVVSHGVIGLRLYTMLHLVCWGM